MRWEDLITEPAKTICAVADSLNVPCSEEGARAIWKPMDHVNLLRFHKHNYRRGHGIVGDWKNSLVNEHLDIFREYGFDEYLAKLEYPPLPDFDPRRYSPFQKLIARYLQRGEVYRDTGDPDLFYSPFQKLIVRYLQRGEVYRDTGDPDLFGFAFNKTNIDASKFGFKSLPRRKWTHVERSTVSQDALVEAVSDTAEEVCEKINNLLLEVLATRIESRAEAEDTLNNLEKEWIDLMGEIPDGRGLALCSRLNESLCFESA
jgi:hypothetical protein